MTPQLPSILKSILSAGGKPYEVGGCVRDRLLGSHVKDLDIEVFHLGPQELISALRPFGRVDQVGVSFGVIKLRTRDGVELDFTLPRRESKTGRGHRGFQVEVDHTMTIHEAAARRDFTINAIYRCPLEGHILDPYGGEGDLRAGLLRATSQHFVEDPLRVLRGMQFAARFNLRIEAATRAMCQTLREEANELAVERIWHEWHKWATRSRNPGAGLTVLEETGWLSFFPELQAMIGVPQDPVWHPEGDVWIHTRWVCDAAAVIADRDQLSEEERIVLLFAALCHDLGKPATTRFFDDHWRAHGHCEAGLEPTERFLTRIGCPLRFIEQIKPLVAEHLVHTQQDISPRSVRRLAHRLGAASIAQLVRLIEADMGGRPPLPGGLPPSALRLIELADQLKLQQDQPRPIMQGRHIIQQGHAPARWFGSVLQVCFEAQLDGHFVDEAGGLQFLIRLLAEEGRFPEGL